MGLVIKQNFPIYLDLKKNRSFIQSWHSDTQVIQAKWKTDAKDGNIKYYLDENKDYVVPKRKLEDIVKYL